MKRFTRLWGRLRENFWLVPSLIVTACMVLAVTLTEVDASRLEPWLARWPRVFGASAQASRDMLSTIAGSMMTVVGVSFSMTLVTLALASSQYSSRILRNFMADRVTQAVLGIFAGIFTYCLMVQRAIRGGEDEFVPSVAVTFGVVIAIASIGVLILFIHHIASSIQASSIIAAVARETLHAVDRLFPEKVGRGAEEEDDRVAEVVKGRKWQPILAPASGYIQSVDTDALLRLACEHRTVVRMECGIGGFVVEDTPLAAVAQHEAPPEELADGLRAAYAIDRHRTLEQDAAFGIRQLVDIALRALSPGINDTTTAVMCVDYLAAILVRLATRDIPGAVRFEDGEPRVVTIGVSFRGLVAASFDQIRGSAAGNAAILLRLLRAIGILASVTRGKTRREALRQQVDCIAEAAANSLDLSHERERVETMVAEVRAGLQDTGASKEAAA